MARAPRRGRTGGPEEYDFTGVRGRVTVEPAWYHSKVTKVEKKQGNEHPYWAWEFTILDEGEFSGAALHFNTSTSPNSLWNFRGILEALGFDVSGKFTFNPTEAVDRELMLKTDLEEYQGKDRPRVVDYAPLEGESEGYTEDQINEMSATDLAQVIEEHGLKVRMGKKLADNRAAVLKALEEAGLVGEAAEAVTYTEEEIEAMSASDLDDVVATHELEVPKTKLLSKYKASVLAALTEAGLISDGEEATADEPTSEGYTEDDIDAMDKATLEGVVKEHDLKVAPQKLLSKYKASVIEALEAKGLMAETETETYSADELEAMGKADLEALVEKHGLEVPAAKTLSRYRSAVIDALTEAGLVADESDASPEGYTEEAIDSMSDEELDKVIADHTLDIPAKLKGTKRKLAIIQELETKDLIIAETEK